jgi:hypothetical protein
LVLDAEAEADADGDADADDLGELVCLVSLGGLASLCTPVGHLGKFVSYAPSSDRRQCVHILTP